MMNTRGKVLHICTLDKFIPPFIDFLEEHFTDFETRHVFCISGKDNRFPIRLRENIAQYRGGRRSRLIYLVEITRLIQKADKIVLHGLFDLRIVQILACMPWVLKKCYWIMWGGDLYVYKLGDQSKESWHKNEFWRKRVIRNIGYLVTGTPGDVELARKWYDAQGKHIKCFNYPSNVFENTRRASIKKHTSLSILIGNSADPSNRHKEVLDMLDPYKGADIKLFCPLSYGDQDYALEVARYGKAKFGSKFFALTSFVEKERYYYFLQSIDIAIFNHPRQQAFGNTLALLGYGKKVFMRKESTLNEVLSGLGVKVFDINELDINTIDTSVGRQNAEIIESEFSSNSLVKSLGRWIQ